jgi:glycosyltransferase involved in cell wall biosynthesis
MGASPERIKIVPYGIDSNWFDEVPHRKKGRALFVGSVGLRKGNHYLAQAVRLLQQRNIPCEARVVGPYKNKIIEHPEFQGPQYIGQVPRSDIKKEFLQADIFVLPTLSDSFALVHLEAMACGVPVITTPNCGSVVRDGVDGFIVPIRDAKTLANRMEQLLTDDNLRHQMSVNARERAKEFTWDKYCDRLLNAFQSLSIQS